MIEDKWKVECWDSTGYVDKFTISQVEKYPSDGYGEYDIDIAEVEINKHGQIYVEWKDWFLFKNKEVMKYLCCKIANEVHDQWDSMNKASK